MVAIGGVMVLVLVTAIAVVIIIGDLLADALAPEAPGSRLHHPFSANALHYEPAVAAQCGKQRTVPLLG